MTDNEHIEIDLVLDAIYKKYGYDFRNYAYPSLKRRIHHFMEKENLSSLSELQGKLIADESVMEKLLLTFSINVTQMFRNPAFYKVFRKLAVNLFTNVPVIRIWHAGCSTGEEVYSMAILLTELGLYDKCRLYATDFNLSIIKKAQSRIFHLSQMKQYTKNYISSGGERSFSDYYKTLYNGALFNASLSKNMIFSVHNLVTDHSFNEFHVVVCRNVFIYFNRELQNQVIDNLFYGSLIHGGVLGLGDKESLHYANSADQFKVLDQKLRWFQKN